MKSRTAIIIALLIGLAACGKGGGGASADSSPVAATVTPAPVDPRGAAIAAYLNSDKTTKLQVMNGPRNVICDNPLNVGNLLDPALYERIKGAHVHQLPHGGGPKCYQVTWDASIPLVQIGKTNGGAVLYGVGVGDYVVKNVGDEKDGPLGTKVTPYQADFTLTPVGKSLAAAHAFVPPKNITDGELDVHKDPTGKWVASL